MANQATWTSPEADRKDRVTIHVGDTVRVHYKLIEREKVAGKAKREVKTETRERTQVFEGMVIGIKGSAANCMFTVRHVGAGGIGVERIFPLLSPWIKNIEVKKRGNVRRAKLYYLRHRTGRAATRIAELTPRQAAVGEPGAIRTLNQ